jgi:hypothetical protein
MEYYLDFARHVAEITHFLGKPPYDIERPDSERSLGCAHWNCGDPNEQTDDNEVSLDMSEAGAFSLRIHSLATAERAKLYAVLAYAALGGIYCRITDDGANLTAEYDE